MKRFLLLLAVLAIVAWVIVVFANDSKAAPVGPLYNGRVGIMQRDLQVEPFSGYPGYWPPPPVQSVQNPNGCLWDFDDTDYGVDRGYMLARSSVAWTGCINATSHSWYTDFGGTWTQTGWAYRPVIRYEVTSPVALTVTVCYQPGQCLALPVETTSIGFRYSACVTGPSYDSNAPELQVLSTAPDGIHYGTGVVTSYSLNITNETGRRVKPVDVVVRGGNDTGFGGECGYPKIFAHTQTLQGPDYFIREDWPA